MSLTRIDCRPIVRGEQPQQQQARVQGADRTRGVVRGLLARGIGAAPSLVLLQSHASRAQVQCSCDAPLHCRREVRLEVCSTHALRLASRVGGIEAMMGVVHQTVEDHVEDLDPVGPGLEAIRTLHGRRGEDGGDWEGVRRGVGVGGHRKHVLDRDGAKSERLDEQGGEEAAANGERGDQLKKLRFGGITAVLRPHAKDQIAEDGGGEGRVEEGRSAPIGSTRRKFQKKMEMASELAN